LREASVTSTFRFLDDFDHLSMPAVRVAADIGHVSGKAELLDRLATQLSFPEYFGSNWDALSECLRDLSWIGDGDVAIVHRELPTSLGPDGIRLYLGLLKDAAETWRARATRELVVAFPRAARETVSKLLDDRE
jgi:hypothetical protein